MFMVGNASGQHVYQTSETFVQQAFDNNPPSAQVLWLDSGIRNSLGAVLEQVPDILRIRYWRKGSRTAWILERIGKHEPITAGVVVDEGLIRNIKVLVYRESRGWEVHKSFFTDQFVGASLDNAGDGLDRRIDGVTGATLSARALTDISEMALVLHDAVVDPGA